jgi:DNA-binding transcriptional regulator PaaX
MGKRIEEELLEELYKLEGGEEGSLARKLLVRIGFSGFIVSGMLAPNLFQGMNDLLSMTTSSSRQVGKSLQYLKKNGLVAISVLKNGEKKVILTKKGKERLQCYCLDALKIKNPRRWDKKWRIVIFDIPNEKNTYRVLFRKKIKDLGFWQIQKSVWVCPYKCEDEIFFLAKFYHIDRYVDIIVAQRFFNDEKYKKVFFEKK